MFPSNRFLPIGPIVSFAPIVQSSHQPVPMTVSPLAVTPFLSLLRNRSIGPGKAIGSIRQNAQSPNRAQDPIGPIGQLANRAIGQVPQSCNRGRQPIAQSLTCNNLPIGHSGTFEANRSNRARSVLQRCSNLAARQAFGLVPHWFPNALGVGGACSLTLRNANKKLHSARNDHDIQRKKHTYDVHGHIQCKWCSLASPAAPSQCTSCFPRIQRKTATHNVVEQHASEKPGQNKRNPGRFRAHPKMFGT